MTFELKYIGNADQTPLTFDIVTNSTVSEKGVKSVSILTTGHEKDRFTVMLACLGDGTKLPPYVIFKRKTLPKNANFPKEVIVRCQEKGWMDQGLVQDWLRTVWSKVGGLARKKSMLVWDSFRAHLSAPIRSTLKSLNTEPVVIPGGMTSMVQPLEVAGVDAGRPTHPQCKWLYPQGGTASDLPVDLRGLGRHSK